MRLITRLSLLAALAVTVTPAHAYKIIMYGDTTREIQSEGASGVIQPGGKVVHGPNYSPTGAEDITGAPRRQSPPVVIPSEYADVSTTFTGDYAATFNDVQDVQITAAMASGIEPLTDASSISALVDDGTLLAVSPDGLFECTAEYPYLTPKALAAVLAITERYQAYAPGGRLLKVSSCLRTHQSVASLMRVNGNAVRNSCHLYGTTFDISYSRMSPAEKLALGRALAELREGGYIYVKYEVSQPCFHITAR